MLPRTRRAARWNPATGDVTAVGAAKPRSGQTAAEAAAEAAAGGSIQGNTVPRGATITQRVQPGRAKQIGLTKRNTTQQRAASGKRSYGFVPIVTLSQTARERTPM